MKVRNGYVSNSSSSSFTCDVCGFNESGYDLTLSDVGMVECECGKCFCERHMMSAVKVSEAIQELEKNKGDEEIPILYEKLKKMNPDDTFSQNTSPDDWNDFISFLKHCSEEGFGFFPSCVCPFCNMEYITDSDILNYVLKKYNLEKENVKNEMRFNFQKHNELVDFIK